MVSAASCPVPWVGELPSPQLWKRHDGVLPQRSGGAGPGPLWALACGWDVSLPPHSSPRPPPWGALSLPAKRGPSLQATHPANS